MARAELLGIFFDEAGRHLRQARALCQADGPADSAGWNELFRALHSVKGMAAALGYDRLVTALHAAESEVDAVRRQQLAAEPSLLLRLAERIEALQDALAAIEKDPWHHAEPNKGRAAIDAVLPSSRIDAARLDRLLEIAVRLSAAHQRLDHLLGPAGDPTQLAVRDALSEAVQALRREVLEVRLAPVQWLVPLLQGALMRWARARGVDVAFTAVGDSVQVDRLILEGMLDPLAQLMRNSIVHGIEPEAERRQAGKAPRGTLTLTVERGTERLRLTLADDGRGIDPAEVVARARARGLELPRGTTDPLALLTLGGLSGQHHADLLAGRGVGLSAVREAVERFGGSLHLQSRPGQGFVAVLSLPTRVAVMPLLLVSCAGEMYAVPVGAVREVRTAGKFQRGLTGWGSDPVVPLDTALGAPEGRGALTARAALVVGEPPRLLLVDRVFGRRELVCRPIGPPLDAHPCLTGAALLPEGGLALVLEPAAILRRLERVRGTIPV